MPSGKDNFPSYRYILQVSWPIILANMAVPLLGLVDTAVIGRGGTAVALGAIALGALVFNFVYWTFGFLRMSTTGLVAQAAGANDELEVRLTTARAMLFGALAGCALIVLSPYWLRLALALLEASAEVETLTATYVRLRVWGAPAALVNFAVMGALIGLGRTRPLLALQLFMNGLNIVLDVLFVVGFGWGVRGVALGTVMADWAAACLGLTLLYRVLSARHTATEPWLPWARLRQYTALLATLRVQGDILLRTLFLLFGFAWFTQQGARFGDATLAANHLLQQLISFSAFFLDGIAFSTESLAGRAAGSRRLDSFQRTIRRTTLVAVGLAAVLSLALVTAGYAAILLLTDIPEVRLLASRYMPYAAAYVLVAVFAFQLDGVFIGTTRTRELRHASLLSFASFVALERFLTPAFGNHGLWLAMIGFAAARGLSLAWFYPRIARQLAGAVR